MEPAIEHELAALLARCPEQGVAMGELVGLAVARGYARAAVEQTIWRLLERRALTLTGFVRRTLQAADGGALVAYEPLLIPWSAARDGAAPPAPPVRTHELPSPAPEGPRTPSEPATAGPRPPAARRPKARAR